MAIAISLPRPLHAQPASCSVQNGVYACTSSGTSVTNGFYCFQTGAPNALPMTDARSAVLPAVRLPEPPGGRLRVGYEIPFSDWYIRPYGDLDVIYTNLPGFRESGQTLYALNVHGGSKTSVALSPMVEVGGRLVLDERTVLRPFAAVGLSLLPNNTRSIDANFIGAAPDDGTFRSFLNSPGVLANIEVGAQLYRAGGFEVKAEYDASIGGSFLSQSASARLAYHF